MIKNVAFIEMHNYYHGLSKLTIEECRKTNFDHRDSFDMQLLIHDLEQLLLGNAIEYPIYDFKINWHRKRTKVIRPGVVIIIDGIFALENAIFRELSTIKIFVDTDSDTRLLRRINVMLVSVIVVLIVFYNNTL